MGVLCALLLYARRRTESSITSAADDAISRGEGLLPRVGGMGSITSVTDDRGTHEGEVLGRGENHCGSPTFIVCRCSRCWFLGVASDCSISLENRNLVRVGPVCSVELFCVAPGGSACRVGPVCSMASLHPICLWVNLLVLREFQVIRKSSRAESRRVGRAKAVPISSVVKYCPLGPPVPMWPVSAVTVAF